ncbi:hypothetical protein [Actinoallomurus sp. NPDC050550]|uniref:hypothetical protein n=1 Tax=Actinoallomurus sp. NPDC050550 TaxID=3154937 RepID=UPI00340F281E
MSHISAWPPAGGDPPPEADELHQIAARPCGRQRICAELADALVRQLLAAGLDLAATQTRAAYHADGRLHAARERLEQIIEAVRLTVVADARTAASVAGPPLPARRSCSCR